MENYIVSARKYRPSTFKSVVGQRALTTTLKNAIGHQKLAHAYLFCGPRGVGKTTCARIFAKTINCTQLTAEGEACNVCESCISFNEQRSYNISELDAASNNSVDDIRTLTDQVRIPPQLGKYKVYIIDEVHMLSQSAFNAFLKTLEEPPKHAIFILATTEKHKILPTILSRCQIYEFSRITISDTVEHLTFVAEQEGVSYEAEALHIIAEKSDGGMRDALSIFDQVVSYSGGKVTYQSTIENLNVLDYEAYFGIVSALLASEVSNALLLFNRVISKGFDGQHFISGLASHLRNVLVSKDAATLPLLEVAGNVVERYAKQAQACSTPFLYRCLELANECDVNYRISNNKRLLVEIALIKMCQSSQPTAAPLETPPATPVQPAQVQSPPQLHKPTTVSAPPPPSTQQAYVASPATPERAEKKSIGHTISIKRPQTTNETPKEETVAPEIVEITPFTVEALHKAWLSFIPLIEKETILINTMKSCLPTCEGNSIEVALDNQGQLALVNERAGAIVGHLRKELRNGAISMKTRETEKMERTRALSEREQALLMKEESPYFATFIKELDLMEN